MYYNYDKVLSYNAMISFIIGERGVGKSYGAKDYCLKHFKKTKKKFAWLRRYSTDLDSAIGNSKTLEFFKDIKEKYNNVEFSITENKKIKYLSYNNRICGYGMSLKSAESLKGTAFNDVDTIIMDEFLVGDGGSRYIKDEPKYLLSIIESIARLRKIRVILLGNATNLWNPYFEYFNIHLPYNSEFATFKSGEIVVNYVKNLEYRKKKKETAFGKIIEGTDYEKYAIDNIFVENNNFIDKRPNNSKLFFNLLLNDKNYGVWLSNDKMFVSSKYNQNKTTLTFDYNSHSSNNLLVRRNNVFVNSMINFFKVGNLYFENNKIKYQVLEILTKLRAI